MNQPIISVGIILPIDKLSEVTITFPKPNKYTINSGLVADRLHVNCNENSLEVDGNSVDKVEIGPKKDILNDDLLTVEAVPTGRGFHWQKTIDVKLPGKIIIENIDGFIHITNKLSIEEYLPYVATSEMSPDCPQALLEAQTIAARSWLLANRNANHPDLDIDVCNDDCCQRYQGITEISKQALSAITKTTGQVLRYRNEICDARYSKSCGGITESFENAWGGDPIPYLSSVSDSPNKNATKIQLEEFINSSPIAFCGPDFIDSEEVSKYIGKVDKDGSYFRWQLSYTHTELTAIINDKLNLDALHIRNISPLKRGYSGRIVKLQIDYFDQLEKKKSIVLNSEYEIRNALHVKFLYSSAILIDKVIDSNRHIKSINIKGAGWGHGVGLCQIGALGMALNGYSAKDILLHYFKGANIETIY